MSDPLIDARGPRFGAAITAVLLLLVVGLELANPGPQQLRLALVLFAVQTAVFAWGAARGIQRHPYGFVYRKLVAPRLAAPTKRESPIPPTFAQGVGFVIAATGLVLDLLGVPGALLVAAAAAFVAAFLNAVFDYCLGCQIYLLLVRAGIVGRKGAASA